jgi:predicted nucleotidyltransferase
MMLTDLLLLGSLSFIPISSKVRMLVNSDFKELLKTFNDHQVKYLVVGGYAVIRYAEPRYTKDIDLWISADEDNAAAVYTALRTFGAPLIGLTEDDFAHEGYFYQMGVAPVRVDILMSIPGLRFEQAWERRVMVDFDGIMVPFISKQDLITSKIATGRPQDLIDAQLLREADED